MYNYSVLPQLARRDWISPSRRWQPFEREDRTRFKVTGRLADGAKRWEGWFDDREDADAFLLALLECVRLDLPVPKEIARLPVPMWEDLGYPLIYYFDTVVFKTATSSSNQSHTVALDWANNNNFVHIIGHGGDGGNAVLNDGNFAATARAGGGGGGTFAGKANIELTPGGSATYRLRTGGVGSTTTAGNWFNGADFATASVAARGGSNGSTQVNSGSSSGGSSSTSSNIGDDVFSGGSGQSGSSGGDGGGAAGPNGSTTGSNAPGLEYTTHGSGDGGNGAGSPTGGALYGGGGGGGVRTGGSPGNGTTSGGDGAQALMVISYGPVLNLGSGTGFFFGGGF